MKEMATKMHKKHKKTDCRKVLLLERRSSPKGFSVLCLLCLLVAMPF